MKRLKDMAHKALHPGAAVIALLAVAIAVIVLRRSRPGGPLAGGEN